MWWRLKRWLACAHEDKIRESLRYYTIYIHRICCGKRLKIHISFDEKDDTDNEWAATVIRKKKKTCNSIHLKNRSWFDWNFSVHNCQRARQLTGSRAADSRCDKDYIQQLSHRAHHAHALNVVLVQWQWDTVTAMTMAMPTFNEYGCGG